MDRHRTLTAAWLACAALAACGGASSVGFHAETGTAVLESDDRLTVISPYLLVEQRVGEPVVIDASMHADLISSATVDVVTSATTGFVEERYEGSLGARVELAPIVAHAGYIGSTEHDTVSHRADVSGELALLDDHLTVSLSYVFGLDAMGTVREPRHLWRDRWTHRVDATGAYVLGKSTVASIAYTVQHMAGYLSSPYRIVPIFPRAEELWVRGHAQWVPERHPRERTQHSGTLRVRHALTDWLFLNAAWRGYLDTWAIRSHTVEAGFGADLGAGFVVEAWNRLYWQSRASFYRAVYTVNREFITRDRRLAGMLSDIVRLDLRYEHPFFVIMLRGELHWTRYGDFQALGASALDDYGDRLMGVGHLAVSMDF